MSTGFAKALAFTVKATVYTGLILGSGALFYRALVPTDEQMIKVRGPNSLCAVRLLAVRGPNSSVWCRVHARGPVVGAWSSKKRGISPSCACLAHPTAFPYLPFLSVFSTPQTLKETGRRGPTNLTEEERRVQIIMDGLKSGAESDRPIWDVKW
ncbi:hypothetical protein BDK51DRAFT_48154 [Blyttiomyces helicus]|uniref:Uncharacterized protein n=1 Tax=Blyttiomyces helicus TaxID=388810 RepID=A0A4P9W1F0_9FUNG|nr:hypothetical protein BDK51DRAFT_48154 [Blyttiomyces helicus]|eukprot:RKO85482.1 hypothetical protein BDK51DRAFT_48154 [Blyttiomyces helicus]